MAHEGTCEWIGKSGTKYRYYVYPIGHSIADVKGNYIYARCRHEDGERIHYPIYIGQGNLSTRSIPGNDRRGRCITQKKPTHFHCHKKNEGHEQSRIDEETDLRNNYDSPCNRQ